MGVHPFRNILISTPSRVKPDSCEIFLYLGVKNGTVFSLKNRICFCFPAGIFKILRIPEETYTLLYFTKKRKSCSKTGKCNLAAKLAPDLGIQVQLWSENNAIMSCLRLISHSNCL
jgi:hypothetical protein